MNFQYATILTYSLGHADTSILDGESLVLLVVDNVNTKIFAGVKLAWI